MAPDRTTRFAVPAAAALLLWPAVWNGYPIVFADTGTYLSQAIHLYAGWDRPVTEKEFEPVYQEMNRRGSILCFHPVVNGLCSALLNDFNLAGSVGTTLEDTLVVLHMIIRQIPHRYPNIKIIVPHLGGSIPMLLNRIDNQVAATYTDLPEKPSVTAKRFWYDTIVYSPAALRFLADQVGSDRLVVGSDYPFVIRQPDPGAFAASALGDVSFDANAAALLGTGSSSVAGV